MPAAEPGPPPETADVAVIGGGITGLAAALTLAQRRAKVVVLEAETIGWGASTRNAGMVLTGLKRGAQGLLARYGRERAIRMFRASLAAIDCVEDTVRREAIACDFTRTGHLEVASKPRHFDDFRRSADLLARDFHHSVTVVPKDALHREIGSDAYHGALVDEASAAVDPARYVGGLARAAVRAGGLVFEGARVERIERSARSGTAGFGLTTTRGSIWTRDVFAATGGYTGPVTPALRSRIVPIGSYIIATEVLPPPQAEAAIPRHRMVFDSKHLLHYFRLTPDRRLLFGGRAAFFPEPRHSTQTSAAMLRRDMLTIFPGMRDVNVDYAWGGTIDVPFDLVPHAGRIDGLHYAMAYAGHGVAMGTYLGRSMAHVMCGDTNENPFIDLAFPRAPLGLYNGRPWFLPLALGWYTLADWIN
ncbi:MAG: FAD-binding oxidoreductase [Acidobacteria bacterium]|nr:FAD-binding oxidoreductase [Acidobacteriota bacterium]